MTTDNEMSTDDEMSTDNDMLADIKMSTDNDVLECSVNEFSCDNKCLSLSQKCDTVLDCEDHSDEADCPTETTTPRKFNIFLLINSVRK